MKNGQKERERGEREKLSRQDEHVGRMLSLM